MAIKKKIISLGIVHIKATFNNTIVTVTDIQGNVISSCSAGELGFKGAKKATPYAAQLTVAKALERAKLCCDLRTISIEVSGSGMQREHAIRKAFDEGNYIITSITDVCKVPHNGVRAPKRRRV